MVTLTAIIGQIKDIAQLEVMPHGCVKIARNHAKVAQVGDVCKPSLVAIFINMWLLRF